MAERSGRVGGRRRSGGRIVRVVRNVRRVWVEGVGGVREEKIGGREVIEGVGRVRMGGLRWRVRGVGRWKVRYGCGIIVG